MNVIHTLVAAEEKGGRDQKRDGDHGEEKEIRQFPRQADVEIGEDEPKGDGEYRHHHHLIAIQGIEMVDGRSEDEGHHRGLHDLNQKHHPLSRKSHFVAVSVAGPGIHPRSKE